MNAPVIITKITFPDINPDMMANSVKAYSAGYIHVTTSILGITCSPTLFLSDRGFSFLSAGVVALSPEEPVEAAALPAVEPAALADEVAVFPSALDYTHTHRQGTHA